MSPATMRRQEVVLFLLAVSVPFSAACPGESLVFSSGFEGVTALAAPGNCWSNGCFQSIAGADTATGYDWEKDSAIWGGPPAGFFLLADAPVDADSIRDYMFNQIIDAPGRLGTPSRVLYSQVTQNGCCGGAPQYGATQNAFGMLPDPNHPQGDLRVSYWLKFQPDLEQQLEPGHWRYVFSWKTGTRFGSNDGDYRMELLAVTWDQGTPYWQLRGDNAARPIGVSEYVEYWTLTNKVVPVPIGEWFKVDVFWHLSSQADGRVRVTIDDEVIFDRPGANRIAYNINRIFVAVTYGGGPHPLYQWLDDLEIWAGDPYQPQVDAPAASYDNPR